MAFPAAMYFTQAEFGKRVTEHRKINGMTQEDLAEKVGVNKLHISRMERGVSACSIDLLLEISAALKVSNDYLLTGKNMEREITRTQLVSVFHSYRILFKACEEQFYREDFFVNTFHVEYVHNTIVFFQEILLRALISLCRNYELFFK